MLPKTVSKFNTLAPDQKKPIYVFMSLNDYNKNKGWVLKKKLHAECENNAHIILRRKTIEERKSIQ
jgi:hypothetical protein